jgi:DNA-binding transcriptional LysR family regulator
MAYSFSQLINRLSFRQLQVFLSVYQLRGYSKAAEALGLTQPAVSSQIKQLEQVLEQPLFEYVGKKLYVTPAGEQLASCVQVMFTDLEAMQSALSEMIGSVSGTLNLAAVSTAQYVVPHLLAGFLRQYPRVQVKLNVVNRAQAIKILDQNQNDLVIMGMVPEDRSFSIMPFLDNKLIPVINADHPLASQSTVKPEDFFLLPMLLREQGSGTRHALEAFCSEQNISLNPLMELGSNAAVKHGVIAGMGVAVMPRLSVKLELDMGILHEVTIKGFPLTRSWYTVHPRSKHLTPAAEAFLNYIKTNMDAIKHHFKHLYDH